MNKHGASKIIDTFETYQGPGYHGSVFDNFYNACLATSTPGPMATIA
jgi:hypothetical protein